MKSVLVEEWRDGQLSVNTRFIPFLRAHGLDTFEAWMEYQGGTVAKNLLAERITTRVEIQEGDSTRAFYLKRHTPPPLKEYIKPLLRLTWPILGARNEWEALIRFHAARIPTMTPVVMGEKRGYSFLVTEAIEGYIKLSDWIALQPEDADLTPVIDRVADIARRMHKSGLHHQDFYLGHFLIQEQGDDFDIKVIDLGRARSSIDLSHRWIIKDLAQLDYSAGKVGLRDKMRFLRAYFGPHRRLDQAEKNLAQRIMSKSRRIARHSQKNRL